ncbi:aldose epimerase family protein [Bacillus weihaiensis]|uniref:aldose epimerase family protein n=1 Tax=Bacillus weihaiensis TaxID=1547283 RepID=UPI0023578A53|nr:aldose epimerase family protein [Bacillus weihaiensis]
MNITKTEYGHIQDQTIYQYRLKNDRGLEVAILNYGCIVTEIMMPDKHGQHENIVLGLSSLEEYQVNGPYFGAVVGRVAGRIKGASFQLDDKTYILDQNDANNHLHGGNEGFSHKVWEAKTVEEKDCVAVVFSYVSKDGEAGYPGNLQLKVTYSLTNENELKIDYNGQSDKKTILNPTNHTYFNLSGNSKRDVLSHTLQMESDQFLELDHESLPTGKKLLVTGTPFDFRNGRKLQDGVASTHEQNQLVGNGYDHPFLLQDDCNFTISLYDEESGREVKIKTDQPSVVLYTANHLSDEYSFYGHPSRKYLGVCLETQGLPDAIHHPEFPSIILNKGERYHTSTVYAFKGR